MTAILFMVVAIGIVLTAVPALLRHPDGSNEASAIGSLRAINSAEAAYASSCLPEGFAVDLADLVTPPVGSPQGFGGLPRDLDKNGVIKSGYIITLERDASPGVKDVASADKTCNGATHRRASGYFASAVPVSPGGTGRRFFATDTRGTVWVSTIGPISNPIPKDAKPVE